MRKLQYLFMALAALCFATPAFADAGSPALNLVPIGVGLGMGLAAGLCGLAQGRAVGSAVEALARNPGARPGIFTFLILGLAFIESLTLFTAADGLPQDVKGSFGGFTMRPHPCGWGRFVSLTQCPAGTWVHEFVRSISMACL